MIDVGLATMIGSLGGSALSAAGGALANYQNSQMDAKNRAWNEEMWNKANLYNLPINQRERLRQAGLNENLVYGNGANTLSSYAGNLSSNRQAQNIFRDAQLGQSILDAQRVDNETKIAESQARKNNAEARSAEVKASVDEQSVDEYVSGVKEALNKLVEEKELTHQQYELAWRMAIDLTNEINAKQKEIFPVEVTSQDGNTFVEYDNAYEIALKKLYRDFEKAGFDAEVSQKMISNIREYTNKLHSDVVVNYADAALKQAQSGYYASMSNLNNQLAATQSYVRAEIASRINLNNQTINVLKSQYNLNQSQADYLVKQAKVAIQNSNIEWYKNFVTNQYGSSVAGFMGNVINQLVIGMTGNIPINNVLSPLK